MTLQDKVIRFLREQGPIHDKSGFAVRKLSESLEVPVARASIALKKLDENKQINRKVRGRRTYRIELAESDRPYPAPPPRPDPAPTPAPGPIRKLRLKPVERRQAKEMIAYLKAHDGLMFCSRGKVEEKVARLLDINPLDALALIRHMASADMVYKPAWGNGNFGFSLRSAEARLDGQLAKAKPRRKARNGYTSKAKEESHPKKRIKNKQKPAITRTRIQEDEPDEPDFAEDISLAEAVN
ncbi:MAG TPA: hypothetical protein VNA68_01795 [Candidatus Dormibacteraeota bacterium]|nr:hypothetical protein [Candidatus Dormibacteraeota bacterium]